MKIYEKMSKGQVLNLRFNQEQGLFTCCMDNGLRIYNVDPLVEKANYDFGSLAQCELLHRTNIFAIVAGGQNAKFSKNTVLIYDDSCKKFIVELVFTSFVKSVRLRRDKVIVATVNQVNVFSFPNPIQRLFTLDTRPNHNGLCEVSPSTTAERHIIAFPGHKLGSVQFVDLASTEMSSSSSPVTINAHKSELACIALNQTGTMIATASSQGTLIRIWDTLKKEQLAEFRRGTGPATLYCINFSRDSEYLCCSSDKGTIHIFALKDTIRRSNLVSSMGTMGFLGNAVVSHRSLATFTLPPECACICAFGSKNSVVAVCLDGTFHKYVFNADGNCNRESFDIYLDGEDDSF